MKHKDQIFMITPLDLNKLLEFILFYQVKWAFFLFYFS